MNSQEWTIDLPDLAASLEEDFSRGPIYTDAGLRYLVEETVARLNGLKVQVFSNEHPPPHFRVVHDGVSANFTIKDCARINGGLDRWLKNIRLWHKDNKQALIDAWNRNRPSDCPVGEYRE